MEKAHSKRSGPFEGYGGAMPWSVQGVMPMPGPWTMKAIPAMASAAAMTMGHRSGVTSLRQEASSDDAADLVAGLLGPLGVVGGMGGTGFTGASGVFCSVKVLQNLPIALTASPILV